MTKHPTAVITSGERRRCWSRKDKLSICHDGAAVDHAWRNGGGYQRVSSLSRWVEVVASCVSAKTLI